ncbi:LLM class flavin-dependent oxidoreductase [Bacillus norwichensis]|uniref:LLM class flavin-dependent oxidoreductase n=1 Tax=Bacillus norwichensis TaxID=2762217 RepID=A0ABR8VQY9_9BACI|nr:LLM class flavin-dependent oxidoreductase [Bacillus norwichensis]MBD8007164.1 LLM class flavin-dependent oxidoreductase [Bacillus norwichensis]
MGYKLGILDQSPVFPGRNTFDALQQTIHLARKAEEWGYSRFWVAEHHHMEDVAGSSPEVLISHLLARTKYIRIGAGGIMLQHYSPYKVVENFHVLSALSPGRVDLGVGPSPGGLPLATKALQYGTENDGTDFADRLTFVKALVDDTVEEHHPLAGIQALPRPPIKPGVFLLGGSATSARLAAELGLHFVFANFLVSNEKVLAQAAKIYHENYPQGTFIAAVAVLAAPDQKTAEELANEHGLYEIHLNSGQTLKVQSLRQVTAYKKQATEPFEIKEIKADIIAGTASTVKAALARLHERYHIDEFILHTPIRKERERLRSFELLSPVPAEERIIERA